METINFQDIDLSAMNPSRIQGTKSTVYINNDKCYKILSGLFVSEKKQLLRKFYDMDGIVIDDIMLPKKLILDQGNLIGYVMDYFPNSINLYDYFTHDRFVDVNDIFKATNKASLIVKEAHKNGIILQDFSFDNILIDNNSNIKICDIDGCQYKNHKGPFISMIMHNYYNIYMKKRYKIDENFDNQALLLSMLATIYHSMVLDIKQYDKLSDKIETLKCIRPIVYSLLNNSDTKVPYLDEVIHDDHYIIDRNKQVSLKKRLVKDYSI